MIDRWQMQMVLFLWRTLATTHRYKHASKTMRKLDVPCKLMHNLKHQASHWKLPASPADDQHDQSVLPRRAPQRAGSTGGPNTGPAPPHALAHGLRHTSGRPGEDGEGRGQATSSPPPALQWHVQHTWDSAGVAGFPRQMFSPGPDLQASALLLGLSRRLAPHPTMPSWGWQPLPAMANFQLPRRTTSSVQNAPAVHALYGGVQAVSV